MTGFALSAEQEANLLAKQTECTFMWTNTAGEPVGLIMNYVWRDGRFWLTATRSRARVPAIEKRPRVAVCLVLHGAVERAAPHKRRAGGRVLRRDGQHVGPGRDRSAARQEDQLRH